MRSVLVILCLIMTTACSSSSDGTTAPATCTEGGKTYPVGASWKCSDGCNTCGCVGQNEISTTLISCDAGTDAHADGGCSAGEVPIYEKAGCDGSVAPVCTPGADTGCVTIVCGCDGKVHVDGCEGARHPFQSMASGSAAEGDPCGDAGTTPG